MSWDPDSINALAESIQQQQSTATVRQQGEIDRNVVAWRAKRQLQLAEEERQRMEAQETQRLLKQFVSWAKRHRIRTTAVVHLRYRAWHCYTTEGGSYDSNPGAEPGWSDIKHYDPVEVRIASNGRIYHNARDATPTTSLEQVRHIIARFVLNSGVPWD